MFQALNLFWGVFKTDSTVADWETSVSLVGGDKNVSEVSIKTQLGSKSLPFISMRLSLCDDRQGASVHESSLKLPKQLEAVISGVWGVIPT